MTTTTILLLCLLAFGAAIVQRVSGFGFGIFIMTALPYLMPTFGEAVTLSGVLALVTSITIVIHMHKYIVWKKLLPILTIFLIVSWFAGQWISATSDGLLKHILGGVLLAASIWFIFLSERIHINPTLPMQVSMGTLSGVMGGLFGMQGPPAVLYFLASASRKEEYMAMAQCYFLVGNLAMTGFRAYNGHLTTNVLWAWCCGLPAVLLGTWLGSIIFRNIPIRILRKIIYIYMGISGAIAIMV